MSLTILSEKFESQEKTFKNVAFASLKSRLNFYTLDISMKENESIEVWIRKQLGNEEADYQIFSMDIHNEIWAKNALSSIRFQDKVYFSLAGTDNTPSKLCYDFSLAYLRLCPEHLISLYDWVFSLEEIEKIEKNGGWTDSWARDFRKLG